jgi:hypothetical protein
MFTVILLEIVKKWKQPKYLSTDEWIKKMRCIYKMEYSSTIKKNEIPSFSIKWMELEIIMLSEISQTQEKQILHVSIIFQIYKKKLRIVAISLDLGCPQAKC